jgi:hypothetical protein
VSEKPKWKPETLRTYAEIFSKPRRGQDGILRPPTEVEEAASEALLLMASVIENR